MSYDSEFENTWQMLLGRICTTLAHLESGPPIVLSSLGELPYNPHDRSRPSPLGFIQGPPGRNIAMAIGMRAALPDTPLVLLMNADSVTLGTNHLIHAARRNVGMTVLLLRFELTQDESLARMDRTGWGTPAYQQNLEAQTRPLEWASALQAPLVGRASLKDPEGLSALLTQAARTRGFSVIGVTSDEALPTGVLSQCERPEYFEAYHRGAAPSVAPAHELPTHQSIVPTRYLPRIEVRIAGLGGQGVKLAGSVLSEAAALFEGQRATQRGDYGAATRGGPSMVDVVISSEPITYPNADHADLLVLLSQAAADRWSTSAKPGATIVADPAAVKRWPTGALAVPIASLAREHTGKPIAAGIVAVGCVAALSDVVSFDALARSIADNVPRALSEANIAACRAGFDAALAARKESSHV